MVKARTGIALVTALVASVLAGCGEGDDDDAATATGDGGCAAEGSGGEDESATGDTLVLWHYEAPNSAMGVAWNEAIDEFEDTHPGVEVELEEKGFEQIQRTAPMVLNSDEAPDLMEYNKGNATTGLLSQQGLLTDITAEVLERGWDDQLAASVQTTACYDEQGVMGTGNWYGVPNYAEYLMVFYNQELFDQNGVEVPTSLDELTAAMDTFVDNGVVPLANAGKEYPAQQYLYQLALSQADRDWVDAYELYDGEVDFHDEAWTYAAETFADWVEAGYFGEDSAGLVAEDAGVSFISGDVPMFFSGSWWYGRFADEVDFDWGTFLWPDSDLTLGSSGNLWVVPENAENKELAYDFIDITMQQGIQTTLGNHGGVPVAADTSQITDEENLELIDNFNTIVDQDGLAFYPDWPVAGFYDTLVAETQKLINGDASADEVLDNLQQAYDAGIPE